MPERVWREGYMLVRETVGDHEPQTLLLKREFGDSCDGISRAYELAIRFDVDPYAVYLAMRESWLEIVPEDYRTVWEGYVKEPHYVPANSPIQVGYLVKAWFFAYEVPMDKLIRAKKGH